MPRLQCAATTILYLEKMRADVVISYVVDKLRYYFTKLESDCLLGPKLLLPPCEYKILRHQPNYD